ncbi:MAG: hypothetical protein R6V47_02620 [Candidatus Delongbacteria bacterium]
MKKAGFFSVLLLSGILLLGQNINEQNFNRYSLKIGYSVIQHLEPQIYGDNVNTQSVSVFDGNLSGLEAMDGINLKAHYFFKNNIGVYIDLGFGNSSNSVHYSNEGGPFVQYETSADYNSQSIGLASRFTFEKTPLDIILGTSIGRFGYNMSYSSTSDGTGQWYDGEYDILKFGIEALLEYNVFRDLNLFAGINYSTQLAVDSDDIYMEYTADNGDFYNIVYNSPSMAAINLSLGLGYNF